MAHFAKIVNNIVTDVIVAEQDFIDEWHSDETWVQTSYNTYENVHYGQDGNADGGVALRGNYAGVGYTYDSTNDVFYEPQPFPSWTINTSLWKWEAPLAKPNDGKNYNWIEDNYQLDNNTGWVEDDTKTD